MSKQGAEKAIITSALVVFTVYFYRHLTELDTSNSNTKGKATAASLFGIGTPANVGIFVTAWGFIFFVLSVIGEAAPGLGGSLAILVAVSDFLSNGQQVAKDIQSKTSSNPKVVPSDNASGVPQGVTNPFGPIATNVQSPFQNPLGPVK